MSFDDEVNEAKALFTLPMLSKIAKNEMPECFEFTRPAGVALAQLLMTALQQNEELTTAVQQLTGSATLH